MSAEDPIRVRLNLALEIAREAGQLTLGYFQQANFDVERKSDDSPVTQADRGAEQLMRGRIESAFPSDGIIGEEFGETPGDSGFRWILDPIDGTKSFISGVPLYSVLVGVLQDVHSVAGVILIPGLDECVYASRGNGAWWMKAGQPRCEARTSSRDLASGLFVTSQVDTFAKRGAAGVYKQLEASAYITRSWGDGYGYLLVATGRAEVMVDPMMSVWDAAAIQPILEEAGGSFTDWQGKPTVTGGEGIGANRQVLEQVLAITREAPKLS